jgi:hypothetical protein
MDDAGSGGRPGAAGGGAGSRRRGVDGYGRRWTVARTSQTSLSIAGGSPIIAAADRRAAFCPPTGCKRRGLEFGWAFGTPLVLSARSPVGRAGSRQGAHRIRCHIGGVTAELVIARRAQVTESRHADPATIELARQLAHYPTATSPSGAARPGIEPVLAGTRHPAVANVARPAPLAGGTGRRDPADMRSSGAQRSSWWPAPRVRPRRTRR